MSAATELTIEERVNAALDKVRPSIAMPGRTLSKAAFTRSSMVSSVAALMPRLYPVALHQVVHLCRHRERVVPFALPHVAAEDQADAAGLHRELGLVHGRLVAHLAAARDEHERAPGRLHDPA